MEIKVRSKTWACLINYMNIKCVIHASCMQQWNWSTSGHTWINKRCSPQKVKWLMPRTTETSCNNNVQVSSEIFQLNGAFISKSGAVCVYIDHRTLRIFIGCRLFKCDQSTSPIQLTHDPPFWIVCSCALLLNCDDSSGWTNWSFRLMITLTPGLIRSAFMGRVRGHHPRWREGVQVNITISEIGSI